MMIKKAIYLVAFLLVLASCNKEEKDLVTKVVDRLNSKNSVHFKAVQKYYYQNGSDTTNTPYEAWLVRDMNDSLRKGYVWVDNNYRPYHMVYDKGAFYLSIPPKKITTLDTDFREAFISPVDWIDVFLKPELFKKLIEKEGIKTVYSDSNYKGEKCDKIEIQIPKNKKGESRNYIYLLSKLNHFPLWSKMEKKTKDQIYLEEMTFSDVEFNKVDVDKLKENHKLILKKNPVERSSGNSETERLEKMIHIGEKAPLFEGKYYGTDKEFKLESYIGKNVIIVDFWYTHCPPCVKAMPALSELYTEYEDKGLKIFGLNSVDNQPRSLKNLNTFLRKRKLSYDVIMTQPKVDLMYKINGYPSMYVVDKKGNVRFVEIGFEEEKFEKFKKEIIHLLDE
jgi:thiol-disulfide isomerase/thioredoxin